MEEVGAILKHYIIELINAITNTNLKVRAIAEEAFIDVCTLMREKFGAVNQLFSIILVGLAGSNSQTQSSTIRAIIFTIKKNVQFGNQTADDERQNLIQISDAGFQAFLKKASKIVAIFLRDRNCPQELVRSVLQFLKITTGLLSEEELKEDGGVAKLILSYLFAHKMNHHVNKHKLLVRKMLSRLIRRCGLNYVTRIMPEQHRAILVYIEREKRKSENKRVKARLLELMAGHEGAEQQQQQ